jgi:thermitase
LTVAALAALVGVAIPVAGATPNLPDDPRLAEQWYLRRIGAPEAWASARGAEAVAVAVLDSGAALRHPDLKRRIAEHLNVLEDDERPRDRAGHGTAVAGIIAAEHDNALGIAGVAPNARLLVIKVADDGDSAAPRALAQGLREAVERGARVVNLSVEARITPEVRDAVAHAIERDVVLVAAAGNSAETVDYFTDPFPKMIVVGSTDRDDRRAEFSNYGPRVDLAAPGVELLTLYRGGEYGYAAYTSFSAPQVAGAAALLRGLHPGWSAARVAERLCETADRTPGTGEDWRCGRLNLARAVGA